MFDIAFSELLVIAVVALIVIGPEKLPRVARTMGHLLGRAQRYVSDIKSEIDQEINLADLKKLQSEVSESAHSIEQSIRQSMSLPNDELSKIENEFNQLNAQQQSRQENNASTHAPSPISQQTEEVLPVVVSNENKLTATIQQN